MNVPETKYCFSWLHVSCFRENGDNYYGLEALLS